MNKQKFILILALLGFNACISWGQNLTQQLRGTIVDRQTKNVLADASVMIKDAKLIAISDSNGKFSFSKIPIAKYDLVISKVGYQNTLINGIELNSGKEVVLEIELEEAVILLKEVTVNSNKNKEQFHNPFALVSTRQFGPQEAVRYAGGFRILQEWHWPLRA